MYHPLPRLAAYTAQFVSVRFQRQTTQKIISGTGFFVLLDRLYFVTNRHNLDAEFYDHKYNGFVPVAVSVHSYNQEYQPQLGHFQMDTVSIYVSKNDAEDVAVIDTKSLKLWGSLQVINVQREFIPDFDAMKSKLQFCDFLACPGYPKQFDQEGIRPIVRFGTIASDPQADYVGPEQKPGRRIAYEAFASEGSSGSPVFALPRGLKVGDGLSGGDFRELMLVGINSGHFIDKTKENVGIHSGISYLFKSPIILEIVEQIASGNARQIF